MFTLTCSVRFKHWWIGTHDQWFEKHEGTKEVTIGTVVIMLLLYVDNPFVNTSKDAQNLMSVLENLFIHSQLSGNTSKTKVMFMKNSMYG